MKDCWLNVVTVKATRDIYDDYKEDGMKIVMAKGNTYVLQDVFFVKLDFKKAPDDARYRFINERGLQSCPSKYTFNSWDVEFVKQEYKPYNSWRIRKEDMIK